MDGVLPRYKIDFRNLTPSKKLNQTITPLPPHSSNENNLTRYLMATAINTKKMSYLEHWHRIMFVKYKFICTDRLEVKEMKSSYLLVKLADSKMAEKFLKQMHIDCIPVKIILYKTIQFKAESFHEKLSI